MYNVHMKRYSVAQARQRLSEVLDSAEAGDAVVIERRGVRFRLETARPARRAVRRTSLIDYVDPLVESGQWTWSWKPGSLRLAARRKRR